jgi:hypothetical protein
LPDRSSAVLSVWSLGAARHPDCGSLEKKLHLPSPTVARSDITQSTKKEIPTHDLPYGHLERYQICGGNDLAPLHAATSSISMP